jgi:hypothetical protein
MMGEEELEMAKRMACSSNCRIPVPIVNIEKDLALRVKNSKHTLKWFYWKYYHLILRHRLRKIDKETDKIYKHC